MLVMVIFCRYCKCNITWVDSFQDAKCNLERIADDHAKLDDELAVLSSWIQSKTKEMEPCCKVASDMEMNQARLDMVKVSITSRFIHHHGNLPPHLLYPHKYHRHLHYHHLHYHHHYLLLSLFSGEDARRMREYAVFF